MAGDEGKGGLRKGLGNGSGGVRGGRRGGWWRRMRDGVKFRRGVGARVRG